MHLRGYPKYYVKNGKRRAVYYTSEVRDLTALGWRPEGDSTPVEKPAKKAAAKPAAEPAPTPEPEPVAERIEIEVVEEKTLAPEPTSTEELPDFEFMTKPELIEYAAEHGETLQPNSLKAELVEACKKLVRARDDEGRFVADDPETLDVNEAWTVG
jgi:hypothetical protein